MQGGSDDDFGGSVGEESDDDYGDFDNGKTNPMTNPNIIRTIRQRMTQALQTLSKAQKPCLSAFLVMPLDIIYEILGHLRPRDLINLTRTSKAFRQLLTTRKAVTVWKTARKNMEAPDCPPGMSELQWANLLWGGGTCQECGINQTTRVNFEWLRRICTPCMKEHIVHRTEVKNRYSDCRTLMKLVPSSNTDIWATPGFTSQARFYWDNDLHDMFQKLNALGRDVDMRKPGAQESLEAFKDTQIAHVDAILKHADICDEWNHERRTARELFLDERLEAICFQLVGAGHHPRDVANVVTERKSYLADKPVTNKRWERIRGKLEQDVAAARVRRLAAEYYNIQCTRRRIFRELYQQYCESLRPLQKIYAPHICLVYTFDGFADLISADRDIVVEQGYFADVIENLPSLIAKFTEERQAKLEALVAQSSHNARSTAGTSAQSSPGSANTSPADLATSVFVCFPCPLTCGIKVVHLMGSEQAILHVIHPGGEPVFDYETSKVVEPKYGVCSLRFDARGSLAAASLVKVLALDKKTATPQDLDRIDARFTCLACEPKKRRGGTGRHSLTWRQCVRIYECAIALTRMANVASIQVSHYIDTKGHSSPEWYQLTEEEASKVKHDEAYSILTCSIWTCNHCDAWQKRSQSSVHEHLKKEHAIDSPTEREDFFCDPRQGLPQPRPIHFVRRAPPIPAAGKGYNCLHCPPNKKKRMRIFEQLGGVESHIRAKYVSFASIRVLLLIIVADILFNLEPESITARPLKMEDLNTRLIDVLRYSHLLGLLLRDHTLYIHTIAEYSSSTF
ncbi:hypothetical protein A0H81_05086 [Grifola frondosa]|uniref:F-box domain-containing protein n=1 Tax=Grifola frondosa TaxID=5627 RepID=A0A1C7MIW7_GRIFR|nr:hypothetical protein A0H81_05086 [Grifola frondosa]